VSALNDRVPVSRHRRPFQTDGIAALNRAKKADAAGNAGECANALTETRQLYGLE
jgi:hypothetical protein